MKTYLFIWLLLSFITYVVTISFRYGVLSSISDSYYVMKHKYWFNLFIVNTGILFSLLGDCNLMFFAGSSLCFVSAAPFFKEAPDSLIHTIGACGAIILGMFWLVFDEYIYLPIIFVIGCGIIYVLKIKNKVWWIEIVAFSCVITGLYLKLW